MGGASNIELDPQAVASIRTEVLAVQQSIGNIQSTLKGKLPGGAPWGSNDGGKEFGDSYTKERDNAFTVTDNAISVLGTIADGHQAAGDLMDAQDNASAS